MRKLLCYFVLLVVLIGINPSFAEASSFKDVPSTAEYHDAVEQMVEMNIISGYGDEFKPNHLVTRAQSAKMLSLIQEQYHLYRPNYDMHTFYFKDVGLSDWYYPYAVRMKASYIMDGYTDQTFRGSVPLKRSQAVKLLTEAFQIPIVKGETRYADVPKDAPYAEYVHTLSELKIVKGTKGSFRPHDQITRAQWVMMLNRAIQWHEKEARVLPGRTLKNHPNLAAFEHAEKIRTYAKSHLSLKEVQPVRLKALTNPPYRYGDTTNEARRQALQMTNYLRLVAHLPTNVKMTNAYNESAQAGAGIMAILDGNLTHYPAKPFSMAEPLYQVGREGASTSNLGVGYYNIASSIAHGYMVDSDKKNRQTVGHRLWVLNPNLQYVGFGYAESATHVPYTAMKVFENGVAFEEKYRPPFISWPSESAFPADLFHPFIEELKEDVLPWSVSISPTVYASLDANVRVQLKRVRDGKVWSFSQKKADGFFARTTTHAWTTGETVIFQPTYRTLYPMAKNEAFEVTIEGLKFKNGQSTSIQFSTVIFE